MARRINQNRSEGLDENPTQIKHAKLRTLFRQSRLNEHEVRNRAASKGYSVALATLRRFFDGDTRRPHDSTVDAIVAGLGLRSTWMSEDVPTQPQEIDPKPTWVKRRHERREKKQKRKQRSGKVRKRNIKPK